MTDIDDAVRRSRQSVTFRLRRGAWPLLKWFLFAAVVFFIIHRARQLWDPEQFSQIDLKPMWLLAAGAIYAIGWLPSIWFWRKLLQSLGNELCFRDVACAYYCGHLGKYIPGKATVLIIRAGMLKERGVTIAAGALTATYETLTLIAVGGAVAICLSPLFLTAAQWQSLPGFIGWIHRWPFAVPGIVVLAVIVALPLVARLLSRLSRTVTPAEFLETGSPDTGVIRVRLLYQGCLVYVVAWMCHGLSLGFTLRALSADTFAFAAWPIWTAACGLATSVGFVAVFAPGGLGVREGLLIEMMRSTVGGPQAILAAGLLRVVWFVTEILVAAGLYCVWRATREKGDRHIC